MSLFVVNDLYELKKIINYKIEIVPQINITICNKNYKIISSILHHGNTINEGHYTNILIKNNEFIQINDTKINHFKWINDVTEFYVIFLEEIENN